MISLDNFPLSFCIIHFVSTFCDIRLLIANKPIGSYQQSTVTEKDQSFTCVKQKGGKRRGAEKRREEKRREEKRGGRRREERGEKRREEREEKRRERREGREEEREKRREERGEKRRREGRGEEERREEKRREEKRGEEKRGGGGEEKSVTFLTMVDLRIVFSGNFGRSSAEFDLISLTRKSKNRKTTLSKTKENPPQEILQMDFERNLCTNCFLKDWTKQKTNG